MNAAMRAPALRVSLSRPSRTLQPGDRLGAGEQWQGREDFGLIFLAHVISRPMVHYAAYTYSIRAFNPRLSTGSARNPKNNVCREHRLADDLGQTGVVVVLVDATVFKTVERPGDRSLVGSIPMHSRHLPVDSSTQTIFRRRISTATMRLPADGGGRPRRRHLGPGRCQARPGARPAPIRPAAADRGRRRGSWCRRVDGWWGGPSNGWDGAVG